MLIRDRIYGEFDITEPVLLDLLQSKPVLRLQGINQAGASQYAITNKDISRYEHSVGVMLVLRQLGASIEEQIAGLLHDTPHTAFSHVIDFVYPSHNHEFHERFFDQIILNSEIPAILARNHFPENLLRNIHAFGLLERELPDLCADRIDYTLRDAFAYGLPTDPRSLFGGFCVADGEIICRDLQSAIDFTTLYLRLDEERWSAPLEVALFQLLADAMKIALDLGILTETDLFENDAFVYNKLKNSNQSDILHKLEMINPNLQIIDDPDNYDFFSRNKLRYVDPKFPAADGNLQRLSQVDSTWETRLNRHKTLIERGNYVKIVGW